MKYVLMPALIVVAMSCAFKKDGEKSVQAVSESFYAKVSWRENYVQDSASNRRLTRNLNGSNGQFVSIEPITLHERILDILTVEAFLGDSLDPELISTVQGEVTVGGFARQVAVRMVSGAEGTETPTLKLEVSGLGDVLSKNAYSAGSLRIGLYQGNALHGTLALSLRTPPSDVEFDDLFLDLWSPDREELEKYLAPQVEGTQLNLTKIVRVLSRDTRAIQIKIPRKAVGEMLSVPTIGPGREVISKDIILLPMDERFTHNASAIVRDRSLSSPLTLSLTGGKEYRIGVYAIGPGVDEWMAKGPIARAWYGNVIFLNLDQIWSRIRFQDLPEPQDFEVRRAKVFHGTNVISWWGSSR